MPMVLWITWVFMCMFFGKFSVVTVTLIGWGGERLGGSGKVVRKLIKPVALSMGALTVLLMVYGAAWGRKTLRIEEVEISSPKIPESFDGFKIALFSDLHLGNYGEWTALVEEVVNTINQRGVDIAVQGGDLVNIHSGELTPELMKILGSIEPTTYSVLGNHDLGYYIFDTTEITQKQSLNEIIEKQTQMGWRLLQNQAEWIHRSGDSILIGGTSYPANNPHNGVKIDIGESNLPQVMKGVQEGDFAVVVSHTPALFDSIYTHIQLPDLILSGHTHAMQNKITIGNWQWSPAKFLYKYYSGLYTANDHRQLYVNDGMGYVMFPMRIGATPELTIITLKSTQKSK